MRPILRWVMDVIIYITFPLAFLFLLLQQWGIASIFLAMTIVAAAVGLALEQRRPATAPASRLRKAAGLAYLAILAGLAITAAVTMISIAWW